jgi:arylsulfatase
MTPFSQFKGWVAEGGIRNALIVSGPAVQRPKGSVHHGLLHVADILPTLLDVAGASRPATWQGHELPPLLGKSWSPMLAGRAESPRTASDAVAWEIFGNRAVRQGDWKLRWQIKPYGVSGWELFDLASDPAERKDLAAERPGKLAEMIALWDDYARTNNVILPSRTPFETMENLLPQRVPDDPGFPPLTGKRQFVPPPALVADPNQDD